MTSLYRPAAQNGSVILCISLYCAVIFSHKNTVFKGCFSKSFFLKGPRVILCAHLHGNDGPVLITP